MRMMKVALVIFFLSLAALPLVPVVEAAKVRVRTPVVKSAGSTDSTSGYSRAKLSRATNSVVVTFMNLSNVARISYTLSYTSNSRSDLQQQGVVGSLVPSGAATEFRDLYFGTCSHGVCTPHYQITNAKLVIETKLKSGKTHVKIYRIKI